MQKTSRDSDEMDFIGATRGQQPPGPGGTTVGLTGRRRSTSGSTRRPHWYFHQASRCPATSNVSLAESSSATDGQSTVNGGQAWWAMVCPVCS